MLSEKTLRFPAGYGRAVRNAKGGTDLLDILRELGVLPKYLSLESSKTWMTLVRICIKDRGIRRCSHCTIAMEIDPRRSRDMVRRSANVFVQVESKTLRGRLESDQQTRDVTRSHFGCHIQTLLPNSSIARIVHCAGGSGFFHHHGSMTR